VAVAGIATQRRPLALDLFLGEPADKGLSSLLALGADIADNAETLAAQSRMAGPSRPGWVGEETGGGSIRVDGVAGKRREEGEVVHRHGRLPTDIGVVGLLEEGVAQSRRAAALV